jgi:hypothetical protein
MNPTPRKNNEESQKAIDEFLAKGGKIEVIPYGKKTENLDSTISFYGRKKKSKSESNDK